MKAVIRPRYGPPEVLEFVDMAKPTPADDEVLVRVHAASVGAWDWHFLAADPRLMRLSGEGLLKPKVPVAGSDFAGVVEAAGRTVVGLKSGDQVYGKAPGTFAEYTCAPETTVSLSPRNLSFQQAAAVPIAAATALQGLRDHGRLRSGQSVLIIGASGGVGTFAVQIARALGADVTGVCGPSSVDLVASLGAAQVIDYTKHDVTTGGQRYDLVLQLAGTESALRLRRLLTKKGTLVQSSGEGGPWLGPAARLVAAMVLSPFVGQRLCSFVEDLDAELLVEVTELIEAGDVIPVIDRTYPLSQAIEALRHVRDGHTKGKTIITM